MNLRIPTRSMAISNMSPLTMSLFVVLTSALGYAGYAWYRVRARVNRLRKAGLPMPEWNWLTGHLLLFKKYLDVYPSNIFTPIAMADIAREFGQTDMFYLDLWPFFPTMLFVADPDAAIDASMKRVLPKPGFSGKWFNPVMGGPNLLTMNAHDWKYWRSSFNPGFSQSSLFDQVPFVVDSVNVFCDKLRENAGKVFPLEDIATRLTVDIIMKITLDMDMDYQRGPNPIADSLRSMIEWTSFGNPINNFHPLRSLMIKKYGHIMDRHLRTEVLKRLDEYRSADTQSSTKSQRSKSVIALAIESYMADNKNKTGAKLDAMFTKIVIPQIRLFLFAGHDTTTSVLVFTFHMLSKHPEALEKLRKEHNEVLGPDASVAGDILREKPALINQTPYTLAVIKETMRLYAPAGAVRQGIPGVELVDRHGTRYPTEGFLVNIAHTALHYNPRLWPSPEKFIPERWMVEPGHELYPVNGAWRPFEHGPRSCVGQNLSIIELRVTLALTARRFLITPAYEEWDKVSKEGTKRIVHGDRAYPIEKGGAHPAEGYPCLVTLLD